jgi:hypothetical protein
MIKIKFEYNLTKDAYNYIKTILFSSPHGKSKSLDLIPEEIRERVKDLYKTYPVSHSELVRKTSHEIFEPVISYLENKSERKDINKIKNNLEIKWRTVENKYFQALSETIKKPIYPANYFCYLTTLYSCPYFEEENWFMVSAFSPLEKQIYVICHEFMHLQFIYWYKNYCLQKGLTEKEFWHLKEAITFFLNESNFSNIIDFRDEGYSIHKKIREDLKFLWNESDKDFQKFLDKILEEKHFLRFILKKEKSV